MKGILMELLKWALALASSVWFVAFFVFATTDWEAFRCVCFYLGARWLWKMQQGIE
jgi:hypothetical protein